MGIDDTTLPRGSGGDRNSELLDYLAREEEVFRSPARLSSLYSDFASHKTTNPDGFAANSSAWLRALNKASAHNHLPNQSRNGDSSVLTVYHSAALLEALKAPRLGLPISLDAVLLDAVAKKQLVPFKQYMTARDSIYDPKYTAWDYIDWGMKSLGIWGEDNNRTAPMGSYVSVTNLELAGKAVRRYLSDKYTTYTTRIMSRAAFAQEVSHVLSTCPDFTTSTITATESSAEPKTSASAVDTDILLVHLSRDRTVLAYNKDIVKLRDRDAGGPEPITDADVTICKLSAFLDGLEQQCDALRRLIAATNTMIKIHLADNLPNDARRSLQERKRAEQELEMRARTVQKLRNLRQSIEMAAGQVALAKIMDEGQKILTELNEGVGGVEGARRVRDRMDEAMAETKHVEGVLAGGDGYAKLSQRAYGEEEDELELEMERLRIEKIEKESGAAKFENDDAEMEKLEQRLKGLAMPAGQPQSVAKDRTSQKLLVEEV